jgi:hypothetical protein
MRAHDALAAGIHAAGAAIRTLDMPRRRVVALAAISVLAAPAVWAQPVGTPAAAGALAPPLGPTLSCADFVRPDDGTWSAAHPVRITSSAASITLSTLAHFRAGTLYAGVDVAAILDPQCGGGS